MFNYVTEANYVSNEDVHSYVNNQRLNEALQRREDIYFDETPNTDSIELLKDYSFK